MAGSLKPLGQIFEPKPTEPRTTPSLRELLTQPVEALDTYKVTPSLHALLKELLDKAVHRKGQGYWIRAEYGAGKTHFIAAVTILLTNRDPAVWGALRDDALRKEYQAAIGKPKLFPVTFSLLGTGGARRQGQPGPALRARDPGRASQGPSCQGPGALGGTGGRVVREPGWRTDQVGHRVPFQQGPPDDSAGVSLQGGDQEVWGRDSRRSSSGRSCRSTSRARSGSDSATSTTGSRNWGDTTGSCWSSTSSAPGRTGTKGSPRTRKASSSSRRWHTTFRSRSTRTFCWSWPARETVPRSSWARVRGIASSSASCSRSRPTTARSSASGPGTSGPAKSWTSRNTTSTAARRSSS